MGDGSLFRSKNEMRKMLRQELKHHIQATKSRNQGFSNKVLFLTQAYRNAMKIAKAGAVDAILAILPQKAKSTPILPTICITLKSLAVNVRG